MKQRLLILLISFPLFSFSQKTLSECVRYPFDFNSAKELIEKGVDINEKNQSGETPLSLACRNGAVEIAKLLIDKGAKISYHDNYGRTALMYALQEGKHIDLIEYMIKHGASVIDTDKENVPTMFYIYYNSQYSTTSKLELIKLLEKEGANLHDLGFLKQNILFSAVQFGDFETVKYLVEKKRFDLNEKGYAGRDIIEVNPANKIEMLKYLLSKMKVVNYNSYFISAVQSNCLEFVKYLFDNYKIDVNTRDKLGRTALINYDTPQYELFSLLLQKGIDIDAQDTSGMTALMSAVYIGNIQRVILLIDKGAKINIYDHDNWTALDYAEYYKTVIAPNQRTIGTQYEESKEAMIIYLKKVCHAENGNNKRDKHWRYNSD